jgi:hypothetical protein
MVPTPLRSVTSRSRLVGGSRTTIWPPPGTEPSSSGSSTVTLALKTAPPLRRAMSITSSAALPMSGVTIVTDASMIRSRPNVKSIGAPVESLPAVACWLAPARVVSSLENNSSLSSEAADASAATSSAGASKFAESAVASVLSSFEPQADSARTAVNPTAARRLMAVVVCVVCVVCVVVCAVFLPMQVRRAATGAGSRVMLNGFEYEFQRRHHG